MPTPDECFLECNDIVGDENLRNQIIKNIVRRPDYENLDDNGKPPRLSWKAEEETLGKFDFVVGYLGDNIVGYTPEIVKSLTRYNTNTIQYRHFL